jgi:hypothetical protein
MSETLAGWLTLATEQLRVTQERINKAGVTADNLAEIGDYIVAIGEHGYHLLALALKAVDAADRYHPVSDSMPGLDAQADLAHASAMSQALIHFGFEIRQAADRMAEGGQTQ